jgi:hypothetical protein
MQNDQFFNIKKLIIIQTGCAAMASSSVTSSAEQEPPQAKAHVCDDAPSTLNGLQPVCAIRARGVMP